MKFSSKIWLWAGAASLMVPAISHAANGWTSVGQITLINQQPAGQWANYIFIETSGITSNPSDPGACFVRNSFHFPINDDRGMRLFTLVTAAQLKARPVKLYVTGNCHVWGSSEIDGINMQ